MTTSAVSYTGAEVVATPLPSGAEVAVTRSEAVTLAHGGSGKGKGAGSKTAKSSLEAVARSEAADSKGGGKCGENGSTSEEQPAWPHVRCQNCPAISKWSKMFNTNKEEADWDPEVRRLYMCVQCVMVVYSCSEGEAQAKVMGQRKTPAWARRESDKWKTAQRDVKERLTGLTKRGRREMTKEFLKDCFAPYGKFICQKITAKQQREKGSEEYHELLEKLGTLTDPEEVKATLKRMDEIEQELEEERALAFKSHAPEVQARFLNASDYSDEFINLGPGYKMCAFYFCCAGHAWCPCHTFCTSKAWPRKKEDPLATGQVWVCPRSSCWSNYKTKFGMVVELRIRGVSYWLRAPVKSWDAKDLQGCMLEQELKPSTPEELFECLKSIRPSSLEDLFDVCTASDVKPGVDHTQCFKLRRPELLDNIKEFKWDDIFAQFDVKHVPPPTKKQLKAMRKAQWAGNSGS